MYAIALVRGMALAHSLWQAVCRYSIACASERQVIGGAVVARGSGRWMLGVAAVSF